MSGSMFGKAKQCEVQRGTVMPSIERIYPGLLWCCCKCHHSYNTVAKDFLAMQPFFEVNALAFFRFWVVNACAFLFFWINRNILILWYFSEGVLYRLSLITAVRLRIHFQYYPHRMMLINNVPKRYGYKREWFYYCYCITYSPIIFHRRCLQKFPHCLQMDMVAEFLVISFFVIWISLSIFFVIFFIIFFIL